MTSPSLNRRSLLQSASALGALGLIGCKDTSGAAQDTGSR